MALFGTFKINDLKQ